MKYFLVAGEASGDLHASNLMQGILEADPEAQFRFFGGDFMAQKGGELLMHYRDMAFMGFFEVVKNLKQIRKNINFCRQEIEKFKPDVVILVDYPGFNLRIAKFVKRMGLKVFYYIAPKVWAWNESRVQKLKRYVDKLFVIFPFEVDYFKKHGIDAIFEGNPLVDAIDLSEQDNNFIQENNLDSRPIISILAGSRKQEISYNLPVMLSLVEHFKSYQFVIAGAPSIKPEDYAQHTANIDVKIVFGKTYQLLRQSTAAVVTSGTATLEAALLSVPEVVCYRGNFVSMLIAWMVVKVKFISLVNLIMNKEVVKELIQYKLTSKNLKNEVNSILPGEMKRENMLQDFIALKGMLGDSGASFRVAKIMVNLIKQ